MEVIVAEASPFIPRTGGNEYVFPYQKFPK